LVTTGISVPIPAQTPAPAADVARREAADLALFERKAALAKELGATHMIVTEGLPLATWEMDPNDPYPMWFVHHASLLKIFPPRTFSRMWT
jgi:sugar phosphate isomerase/epimerase